VPPKVVHPRRRFSIFDLLQSAIGNLTPGTLAPGLPVFQTPLYLMH
jgi:hypothetical protein